VLQYNAPGGKRNRGLSVIGSLRELVSPSELPPEEAHRALLVGWCIELVCKIDNINCNGERKKKSSANLFDFFTASGIFLGG